MLQPTASASFVDALATVVASAFVLGLLPVEDSRIDHTSAKLRAVAVDGVVKGSTGVGPGGFHIVRIVRTFAS